MTRSLARKDRMSAAAPAIAAALDADDDLHQEAAAIAAGIPPSTYWDWLSQSDDAAREFQLVVKAAVHRQARRNMDKARDEVVTSEGKLTQWHKWLAEKRYRQIYGDLAQVTRHEVSGPGGGAVQIETHALSDAEIAAKLAKIAGGDAPEESED